MKLKKAVLLILIMSLTLSFIGCTKENTESAKIALTVDNASVDSGVFAYYLDKQIKTNDENSNKDEAIKTAEDLSANYVFVNTEFKNRGLVLPTSSKNSLASSVDEIWNLYGGYYEKIGVSKETLTKIKTSEAYKEMLITSVFGAGGEKEISEEQMKTYFNENYVFFKYINETLSGDEEKDKEIKEKFKDINSKIGKEDPDTEEEMTFGDAAKKYSEETESEVISIETASLEKGDDTFPLQLFQDVFEMELDDHKVLTYDDNIFLVQKVDGSDNFKNFKSDILDIMTNTDYEALMSTNYGSIKASGNNAVETACYDLIKSTKTIK